MDINSVCSGAIGGGALQGSRLTLCPPCRHRLPARYNQPPCPPAPMQLYEEGLAGDPSNVHLLSSLAHLQAGRGEHDAARATWARVLAVDATNGHAAAALGRLHEGEGQLAEAARLYSLGLTCRGERAACVAAVWCCVLLCVAVAGGGGSSELREARGRAPGRAFSDAAAASLPHLSLPLSPSPSYHNLQPCPFPFRAPRPLQTARARSSATRPWPSCRASGATPPRRGRRSGGARPPGRPPRATSASGPSLRSAAATWGWVRAGVPSMFSAPVVHHLLLLPADVSEGG